MPIHRIPRDNYANESRAIEAGGEKIIAITVDGDHLLIVTEHAVATRGGAA